VAPEISNEAELPTKYDEKTCDETALPEIETDRCDIVTQDLLKESDDVQLANDQGVEREDDGKDAADEWQDISLVTPCYLFCASNEGLCPQIVFKENCWTASYCFIAFLIYVFNSTGTDFSLMTMVNHDLSEIRGKL